ncbi:flagellar hook-length control protein FliK, partial [Achromobacter xylosoxidans]
LAAAAAASAAPAAETPSTNRPARPAGSGEGATGARNAEATAHANLATGAPSAKTLGQALRAALQTSGLFYESHLTDMVFGRSNPSQLQQEPQARLTRSGVPTDADTARPRAEPQAGGGRAGAAHAAPGNSNAPAPGP